MISLLILLTACFSNGICSDVSPPDLAAAPHDVDLLICWHGYRDLTAFALPGFWQEVPGMYFGHGVQGLEPMGQNVRRVRS